MVTGRDWFHLASAVTGSVIVMKNCAENHYFQVSGKKKIPTSSEVTFCFVYYLFHVPPRKVAMHRFQKLM